MSEVHLIIKKNAETIELISGKFITLSLEVIDSSLTTYDDQ